MMGFSQNFQQKNISYPMGIYEECFFVASRISFFCWVEEEKYSGGDDVFSFPKQLKLPFFNALCHVTSLRPLQTPGKSVSGRRVGEKNIGRVHTVDGRNPAPVDK